MECKRCGECCRNNGMIPPFIPGEEAPFWLLRLVHNLRVMFGDVAEDCPCMMLTHDNLCLLQKVGEYKPQACRDFLPDMCKEFNALKDWDRELKKQGK